MKIIEQGYVTPKSKSNFRYNAWPTVITLKDGTLLAGWSGERLKHICPFGKAMMARSVDGGHTWLPAYVAQDTVLDDRDVGLLQVGDKVIMSSVTNDRNMQRKHQEHWLHHPDTEEKKRFVAAYLDMITDEEEEKRSFDRLSLRMAIEKLSPEHRKLVLLRYFRDLSQTETAKILGLSQVKVSREEKKIMEILRREMS